MPPVAAMMAKPLREIVAEARTLAGEDDPLEAETFASELAGMAWAIPLIDGDMEAQFGKALLQAARRDGGPGAVALLLALAAVQPSWAKHATTDARQLMAQGVPAPAWAAAIGRPRFTGAWLGVEPYGDQDVLLLAFEYAGRPGHSLQVLIDNNLDGMAKDIHPMDDAEGVLDSWREEMPELKFLTVDAETAARRLAWALQVSDEYGPDGPMNEDFRDWRALARSRLRLLPAVRPAPLREPLDEPARQAVEAAFFSSPEGSTVAHLDQARLIVSRLVDYRCDYGDGDPLRWSPATVEGCLCDWYPAKVLAEDAEIPQVPDVLRAWVNYAGRSRGLAAEAIQETLDVIRECVPEFVDAMADPEACSPAKTLLLEMQRDGVDVTSPTAVRRWTNAFNEQLNPF